MLPLALTAPDRPLRVLAFGAHCDDIEIGAGATILGLIACGTPVEFDWVVLTSDKQRAAEAHASAAAFLEGAAGARVVVEGFRTSFLPYEGAAVKEAFERVKRTIAPPDLILTHHERDRHQDHRLVSELTWNTFRDHLILEYEIPKYDGDLGQPNSFVPVSDEHVRRKVALLEQHFPSQSDKRWFTAETFRGLMRLRGIEAAAASGYAEAFHARKVVLSPGISRTRADAGS